MRDKILRTASHQRSQENQLLKHARNESAKKIPGKFLIWSSDTNLSEFLARSVVLLDEKKSEPDA